MPSSPGSTEGCKDGYVQKISTGGWFASCSTHGCDWSRNRPTYGQALFDAMKHGGLTSDVVSAVSLREERRRELVRQ